jgi:hypothetical protein
MKLNWGHKIAIVIVLFMGFILVMVFIMFQYDVDLVAKDYYKQEIAYEKELDKKRNFRDLKEKPSLQISHDKKTLELTFPQSMAEGEILFFRPGNVRKDFKIALQLQNNKQTLAIDKLDKGLWRLKINWENAGEKYYWEEKVEL